MVANLQIIGLCLLHLCLAASAAAYYPDMLLQTSFIPRDYARYADVARRCRSALASADELSPFDPVGAACWRAICPSPMATGARTPAARR